MPIEGLCTMLRSTTTRHFPTRVRMRTTRLLNLRLEGAARAATPVRIRTEPRPPRGGLRNRDHRCRSTIPHLENLNDSHRRMGNGSGRPIYVASSISGTLPSTRRHNQTQGSGSATPLRPLDLRKAQSAMVPQLHAMCQLAAGALVDTEVQANAAS